MTQVLVQAPAKLNLALSVGPPGSDGMHPICSWMVTVDLFDDLTVTRLPDDRLSRYAILWHEEARRPTDVDWSITRDLAVRAHQALERRVGRSLPVQLKLEKRIPVGGGLGGGSADAAAMLRAVDALFDLGLDDAELADIAAQLGSDVPFLVSGGSAVVEGLGERITPLPALPELHAVLAFPDARCETATVYGLYDDAPVELRSDAVSELARAGGRPSGEALFNDLAGPARRAAPRLDEDLTRLSELAGLPSHVTGSGSSLFVICDDPVHAEALAAAVCDRLALPAVPVGPHAPAGLEVVE